MLTRAALKQNGMCLIARDGGVDLDAPLLDTARHAAAIPNALPSKPVDDVQTAHAVMAKDNELAFIGVAFERLQCGRDGIHRHQFAAFDSGDLVFLRLTNVDQEDRVA